MSTLFHVAENLSNAQSGSSLSLASAATNEADSVNSGGAGSQRYITHFFMLKDLQYLKSLMLA